MPMHSERTTIRTEVDALLIDVRTHRPTTKIFEFRQELVAGGLCQTHPFLITDSTDLMAEFAAPWVLLLVDGGTSPTDLNNTLAAAKLHRNTSTP